MQTDASGVALGLAFWLVIVLLVRYIPRMRPMSKPQAAVNFSPVDSHDDLVLVVQPGGRVQSVNERARKIFGLAQQELPNLERLARRARPSEDFLALCAAEGQAQFLFDGRLVQGYSYAVQIGSENMVLVTMRYPELTATGSSGAEALPSQTLQTLTDLTQKMFFNLDLEKTLQAVLESIERLIPADFMEITLWEAESQSLIPYRFMGYQGSERKLTLMQGISYKPGEGLSGTLATERKPLFISDVETSQVRPAVDRSVIPVRGYMGVPLLVREAALVGGEEFVGTLELGSLLPDQFQVEDMNLLHLLSGQAAIAIRNASLHKKEERRASELAGLAQLTQAFSSSQDSHNLYARLVQSIVPLIPVQILGFLLYNEIRHELQAQNPFFGLPSPFVDVFKVPVVPGSRTEQILLSMDTIISDDAFEDDTWKEMGLDFASQAAGMRDTVMVALTSGGRMLGYLLAANHVDGSRSFTQDELRLLGIIGNQTAPIIENVTLVQVTRQRAQRAEALRRITSLASSTANLTEVLTFALQELARLAQADLAMVYLLDRNRGMLQLHRASAYGEFPTMPESVCGLLIDDPQFHFSVTGSQRTINTGNLQQEKAIIPFYQQLGQNLKAQSVLVVPLLVRDEGIGEIWLTKTKPDAFDAGDLQALATASGQLAGVVEQSYLVAQTDESLRRRIDQLTALTRISRELSTSLDLNSLLQLVYDEALRTTRAECGSILLFDPDRLPEQPYKLQFYVGDVPLPERSRLEREALERNEVISVPDLAGLNAAEGGFPQPHDGVASALIVPILYLQKQAGLILLHSHEAEHFDPASLEIAQSLAVQAAVALGNALQYDEQMRRGLLLKRQLDTLGTLVGITQNLRPDQPLEKALSAVATAIREATPFRVVLISVYDPHEDVLRRVFAQGIDQKDWEELRSHTPAWKSTQVLLQSEYRVGSAYFIPVNKRPVTPADMHTLTIMPESEKTRVDEWDPQDFLLVPLFDPDGNPLGLISVDDPADSRRPDRVTFDALDLFGLFASLMVENHQKLSAIQTRAVELGTETTGLRKALQDSQENMPVLLRKDLEQTMQIQSLNRQVQRIRAGLEIVSLANQQTDPESVLHILAAEMLSRFGLEVAVVVEKTASGPRLIETIGRIPSGTSLEALLGQRNPLRQVLVDNKLLMIASLENNADWRGNSLLHALKAEALIGMPFQMAGDRQAAVLLTGQYALPPFTEEDQAILDQLCKQISSSLQNQTFLAETRRRLHEVDMLLEFTRKLGSLDPLGILRSLVESAMQVIPAAQTAWVALWDEKGQILVPQVCSGYGDAESFLKVRYGREGSKMSLPLRVFKTGQQQRIAEVNFVQEYSLSAEDLLNYRAGSGGRLPVSSMVIPLQLGDRNLGVLVQDNFNVPAAFSEENQALSLSLSQQAALALENARLYVSAEQRAGQLQALTRVAGNMSASLKSSALIPTLLEQLREVIPYDTATLWLRQGEDLSVATANGFVDSEVRMGISVSMAESRLFQEMDKTGWALNVRDVRKDERFPGFIIPEYLSWLGIPLVAQSRLIGVIALEKREVDFYSDEHIQASMNFAGQAAISIQNARLYEESVRRAVELDQRSSRLAILNRLSSDLGGSLDVDYILHQAAEQMLNAMGASRVAVVILNQKGQYVLQDEIPANPGTALPITWGDVPMLERLRETGGVFNALDIAEESDLSPLDEQYFNPRKTISLLIVPMITAMNLHGWLFIQTDTRVHFSVPEIELARTMSNQTAISMQNARLYAETRSLTADLEKRVEERTTELRREHNNTETLLRIMTELSASLDLNQVLNRTLLILNETTGAEQSFIMLLQDKAPSFQAGAPLVKVENEGNKSLARFEREVSRWITRLRVSALVDDLTEDARWTIPTDIQLAYRSMVAAPLVMGEDVLGSLLLINRQPKAFLLEQVGLVEATARQISVALNNAELFGLIRDQSESLGSMLREQQIEANRSRGILEAVADGVLVTDSQGKISLFNLSAEHILDVKSDEVIGKPLEQFIGLFGKAASEWIRTIRTWSSHPGSYKPGDMYSEQVNLENGKFVSVHLAPVIWRNEFMGTVSIFRDITHEVQVDRLKSEFVANVSHELRTPMTSIKGYADIMLMGATGKLSDQQRHFLDIIKSNTERLSVLVNDLLDISRLEAGRVSLLFQPVSLPELANDIITDIERRSREENKPIEFELDFPEDLPYVKGDKERLRQVVYNLVNNGYNYTPENGKVIIRMRLREGEVQLAVQDNGIGILPEDQPRIFERFYRGEHPLVLATAGTGLGLSTSKVLVEMHKGRIWFESTGKAGEGSTFSFALPVYHPEDEA
jgi:PAS domain S-box-containing protein